jgi:hypothetical protein
MENMKKRGMEINIELRRIISFFGQSFWSKIQALFLPKCSHQLFLIAQVLS